MSVSGVSSSSSLSQSMQTWQAQAQKIQSEFQQLGQDLQAGNLTQAQSDFSTLSQNISTPMQTNGSCLRHLPLWERRCNPGTSPPPRRPTQPFNRMSSKPAKFIIITTTRGVAPRTTSPRQSSTLSQLFGSLGSALQSGSLSTAQLPIRRSHKTFNN